MPETVAEIDGCWSCGAEVRPDTQFCYNCGKSLDGPVSAGVADAAAADRENGLADLQKALSAEFPPTDDPASKLDAAARERRLARRRGKKQVEIEWVAPDPSLNRIYVLFVIMIFVFAAAIVFISYLAR